MPIRSVARFIWSLAITLHLCACAAGPTVLQAAGAAAAPIEATPTSIGAVLTADSPATPTPAPTTNNLGLVWLDGDLPELLKSQITLNPGWQLAGQVDQAQLRLRIDPRGTAALKWVYALVTPFWQRRVEANSADLRKAWQQATAGEEIWLSPETEAVFSAWWGPPGAGALRVVSADRLVQQAWDEGAAWALVPFEQVEPRWRVLRVDRQSPFDPEFRIDPYPLSVPIGWEGQGGADAARLPPSNYQRDQLTVLAMSGVTALVRRTAELMDTKGVLYPASSIGGWLREADLTHISNEVSFNQDCPPEKAALKEALFCSPPDYIHLLEQVGTDVVELTGNHNLDRGQQAYLDTLDMYAQRGWPVYGGGADLQAATRPLLLENHGNRLAFLGCNMAGPDIAWATDSTPGAAPCDFARLESEVRDLRQAGYLPVVTLQAFETEDYSPAPMQQPTEFLRLAEAGAVVVSGSQAHVPQGFKFGGEGLIHFGLGNLFFDQTDAFVSRRAFVDRHIFYQGRYLGVELFPITLEEYGRPTPMGAEARDAFFDTIFAASGW